MSMSMADGVRAKRKLLITVATRGTVSESGSAEPNREILGVRTEDSSIEFNPDIETSTDILGNNYTDVNKTEPQQDFDPFTLIGGSALGEYLANAALENDIDANGFDFTPIGNADNAFTGEFNGNGKKIYKLVLDEDNSLISKEEISNLRA